jgi:hypothetical protein
LLQARDPCHRVLQRYHSSSRNQEGRDQPHALWVVALVLASLDFGVSPVPSRHPILLARLLTAYVPATVLTLMEAEDSVDPPGGAENRE